MTHTIQELKDGYGITFIEGDKAVGLFSETKKLKFKVKYER